MLYNTIRISRGVYQMRLISARHISLACNHSMKKLNRILEEYRASHYSQEFPTRFRKDVIKAACKKSSESSSNLVSAEGIQFILDNIGAGDQMSRSEIELMLREICADASGNAKDPCLISADQMLGLISNRSVV